MKQYIILFTAFVYSVQAVSQDQPPALIYSAEIKINDSVNVYDIYTSTGKKVFTEVYWAYSNPWSWIFITDRTTQKSTAFNYAGIPFGIDQIEETKCVALYSNRIAVKQNGKWGFYDAFGKLQIPLLFDEVSNFEQDTAAVKVNGEVYLIDTTGTRLSLPYTDDETRYSFEDADIGLGMSDFSSSEFKMFQKGKKKGLCAADGRIIIPADYESLNTLKEHFQVITVKQKGLYGLVSFKNETVIPIRYTAVFVLNDYF